MSGVGESRRGQRVIGFVGQATTKNETHYDWPFVRKKPESGLER